MAVFAACLSPLAVHAAGLTGSWSAAASLGAAPARGVSVAVRLV